VSAAVRCRTYLVDGEPVVVRGDRPLTPEALAALAELARAARALITPEIAAKQDAARARNHARLVRLGMAADDAHGPR
jgi:hypothetical protein